MLNVIMLHVIMLYVIMLSVVASYNIINFRTSNNGALFNKWKI